MSLVGLLEADTSTNVAEMSQVGLLEAEELFPTPAHFPLPESIDLTDRGKQYARTLWEN